MNASLTFTVHAAYLPRPRILIKREPRTMTRQDPEQPD